MKTLTQRQQAVVEYIDEFTRQRGYPPTYREIAARFGFRSPNGVAAHIRALRRKGRLRQDAGVSRGLVVQRGIPLLDMATLGDQLRRIEKRRKDVS